MYLNIPYTMGLTLIKLTLYVAPQTPESREVGTSFWRPNHIYLVELYIVMSQDRETEKKIPGKPSVPFF